jgi:hypothetical protein
LKNFQRKISLSPNCFFSIVFSVEQKCKIYVKTTHDGHGSNVIAASFAHSPIHRHQNSHGSVGHEWPAGSSGFISSAGVISFIFFFRVPFWGRSRRTTEFLRSLLNAFFFFTFAIFFPHLFEEVSNLVVVL